MCSPTTSIQSGSSLDVGGTIDLFEQDNKNGGSLELHGTAKAKVLQGSNGDDQVTLIRVRFNPEGQHPPIWVNAVLVAVMQRPIWDREMISWSPIKRRSRFLLVR